MLPGGGGEFTPFGGWSREGIEGWRLNAGTRWAVLNPRGDGRARNLSLARVPGLRFLIDLFVEQLATRRQPMDRRFVLQGRIGF